MLERWLLNSGKALVHGFAPFMILTVDGPANQCVALALKIGAVIQSCGVAVDVAILDEQPIIATINLGANILATLCIVLNGVSEASDSQLAGNDLHGVVLRFAGAIGQSSGAGDLMLTSGWVDDGIDSHIDADDLLSQVAIIDSVGQLGNLVAVDHILIVEGNGDIGTDGPGPIAIVNDGIAISNSELPATLRTPSRMLIIGATEPNDLAAGAVTQICQTQGTTVGEQTILPFYFS